MCLKRQRNYLNKVISIGMIMFPLSAVDYLTKSFMPRVGNFPLSCWSSVSKTTYSMCTILVAICCLNEVEVSPYS